MNIEEIKRAGAETKLKEEARLLIDAVSLDLKAVFQCNYYKAVQKLKQAVEYVEELERMNPKK